MFVFERSPLEAFMHTASRCSSRRALPSRPLCRPSGSSPLADLDRAFLTLASTGRVSLPGEVVLGAEATGAAVPVDQVRARLVHSATTPEARPRSWNGNWCGRRTVPRTGNVHAACREAKATARQDLETTDVTMPRRISQWQSRQPHVGEPVGGLG